MTATLGKNSTYTDISNEPTTQKRLRAPTEAARLACVYMYVYHIAANTLAPFERVTHDRLRLV